MKSLAGLLCALALLMPAPAALAQVAPQSAAKGEEPEIVVEARLAGAPMWEVTRGDSKILLVGEIVDVPKLTPWRPERLENVTRRAQSIILETKLRVSVGDIFRIMFNAGKITRFPKGTTAADYLSPSQLQRLIALEQEYGKSYQNRSFLLTAHGLLNQRLKFSKDTMKDATDIVRKAAQQAGIPVRPVGEVRGKELIDSLFTASPRTQVACLETAMAAVEAGPGVVAARGEAWTRFDIPAVMASPLEIALGSCWPWTDVRFGPELRGLWTTEIGRALTQKGVTLAVVPMRVLAEDGGMLDQLAAQHFEIKGPAWRK